MVFNSLFGFERSGTAHEVEERGSTAGQDSAGGRIDGRNLGPNREHLMEAEEEFQAKQKSSPLSEAETRVLKALSSHSVKSTEHENWTRLTGFGLGVGSLYIQELLTYPVCIIRRQCQVNHTALQHHLTPFTIFQLMLKIQRTQGLGALWKGWGTSFVFQGIVILTEAGISELTNVPRDLTSEEKVGIKTMLGNQILKWNSITLPLYLYSVEKGLGITAGATDLPDLNEYLPSVCKRNISFSVGIIITLPFYSACLVDSVQSYQLNETRSTLDFLKDVVYRLAGWYKARGHGRLLPMYFLIAPTLLHGMLRYLMTSVIQNAIIKRGSTQEDKKRPKEDIAIESGRTYYMQLLAGFLSALVADWLLYPLETIVIRLHVQGTRTIIDDTDNGIGVVPLCTNYNGMKDCAQTICREEGALALLKGIGALTVQFVIQACILKMTKAIFKRLPQSSEGSSGKK